MRENKFPVILIAVLVLVLVAIIIFGISLIGGKNSGNKNNNPNTTEELIAPILDLSLNTTEEDQESVIIQAKATTEDKDGIKYIELPDGTQIFADTKDYEVTKNGKYEFKAVGNNGAKSKLNIVVKNIKEISSKTPYIPEGFKHVSGDVDTGYIISDNYKNEYVWVPIENGILKRTTVANGEYEDSNSTATGLVNSVAKNFGFYIARYEASPFLANDVKFAGSVEGQKPWTGVSFIDAQEYSQNTAKVLEYPEDIVTSIINSYAWDSVLSWIDQSVQNFSTNTSYGNYSGTILPTGGTESDKVNNIFDLAGNVREWTTEIYKDPSAGEEKKKSSKDEPEYINRVIRGGSAYINKVANSRNGYPENLTDDYWGFRIILYRND